MSSPRFEAFLARLYCDRDFLEAFMRESDHVLRDAGLSERERQAAIDIDRAGLLLAARSFESKRQARRRNPSVLERVSGFLTRRRS